MYVLSGSDSQCERETRSEDLGFVFAPSTVVVAVLQGACWGRDSFVENRNGRSVGVEEVKGQLPLFPTIR